MKGNGRHGVHVWLGDVLDDHRNVEIPSPYRFIVRRRNEPPILINEGDAIHGTKMLVIFLGNFPRVHVVLNINGMNGKKFV